MLKKICSGFAILVLLANTLAFAHTATIENGGAHKYKAIRLTPEIYQNAKGNLEDIMLYDENHEPVPYFINRFTESSQDIQESYNMKLINSFMKDDKFYYDYAAAQQSNHDILATGIAVTTKSQNFAKDITLLGSYDNRNWEQIKEDTLYRVDGNEKLQISFEKPLKYTHYRLQISNNLEKISFDSVKLVYSDKVKSRDYFTEILTPKFTADQKGNDTIIRIEGMKNLEIEEMKLDTDSMFQRAVSYAGGKSKTLYHLMFGQTNYQDLTLPFNGYRSLEDTVDLTIHNGDDKPIEVKNVSITYHTAEIVFQGNNSSYTLSFGNESASPPTYDIVNYKDLILKEGYDILKVSNVEMNSQKAEKKTYDYKLIFNIVIVLVAVLLGFIMVRKLKKKPGAEG